MESDSRNSWMPVSESAPSRAQLQVRGVLVLLVVGVFSVTGLYVVDAAVPGSAMSLPGQQRKHVQTVLPEGWAFFTRDAREKDLYAWKYRDGSGWGQAGNRHHQASPVNLFGVRRSRNSDGIEMGLIYTEALQRKARWVDCALGGATDSEKDVLTDCASGRSAVEVRNPTPGPELCGTVAIIRRAPQPWVWAAHGVDEQMPMQLLRLEVGC
ncbi:SdpA family antimicrobial peptide system protein [Streptomyces aureocirculatus]|uniref:SdpA family antimicrobial peptide system protein n=1 Tax=Streptomyces aureocirculatus TaxID=67275 RepID=UPI0004CB48A8|nr:SdpA family antimicrobial peptide system protein [Streptomyces aureocirculatus]